MWGKIVYVREGLLINRMKNLETEIQETFFFLELFISNKKWVIVFAYRPTMSSNQTLFFEELAKSLDVAVNDILLTGNFNINTLSNGPEILKHLIRTAENI